MKTRSILVLLMLVLGFRLHAQLPAAYASRLQYTLDSLCAKYKIKGASASVYVPGYGSWEGVYGDSYNGVPMRPDMVLPLNSNTKTYVATAMLRLQEAGRLSLDDSIGTWIQGATNIDGAITIREMLNHTSGLYSYTDTAAFWDSLELDYGRIWKPEEMLQFVSTPLFAPGTNWSYSNTNYLLAGMIIAKVSGKPVDRVLRDLIIDPQGLANTWYYPEESPSATIPHFWFDFPNGEVDGAGFGYTPQGFYSAAGSAGALFATAKDNALFWHKLETGQILNSTSMTQWRQTIALSSNISYGLGMFRYRNFNGRVVYTHGGTGAGAINENLVDSASGVSISLLTNQERADNDLLFNIVVKALHKLTLTPPATAVAQVGKTGGWAVFPVPASRELYVAGLDLVQVSYRLRDLSGRIIREGRGDRSVQLGDLAGGSYLLELRNEQGSLGMRRFEVAR